MHPDTCRCVQCVERSERYARMIRHDELEALRRTKESRRNPDGDHGPWCECNQCHAADYRIY